MEYKKKSRMRLVSLLFFVGNLLTLGFTDALTTYYATQGFTPPGGCAGSTGGYLNVGVTLPVPPGATGLQIKEVSYAFREIMTSSVTTMTITANGVTASANPQTGALNCCSSSFCDLQTYSVNVLGASWYDSPCGVPSCGIPHQWYKLPFTTGWYPTNGASSLSVNIEFGGQVMNLADFGLGASFFVSYYANFPSPTPTPSTTSTASYTPTPSTTSTVSYTPTPSTTSTVSYTPTPSTTSTMTLTATARPTPTPSSSATASASSTATMTASSTISPTPSTTNSPILVRNTPQMSDFTNTTLSAMPASAETAMATILSGTTVGITGMMAVGLMIQQLRKTGVLNLLRSLGIRVPMDTSVKTEQDRKDEDEGENSTLGKAAKMITKAKKEREKILKTIDDLPLPDEIKQVAHNPKKLLTKSAQKKVETVERDIEKGLSQPVKISSEQLEQFHKYMESLGVKVPPKAVAKEQPEEFDEEDEDYRQALEETQEEEAEAEEEEETPVPESKKKTKRRDSSPARKAILEVNEKELEEIKQILASKKKDYIIV